MVAVNEAEQSFAVDPALPGREGSPLLVETPALWVRIVEGAFDEFIVDHAAAERKAAVQCLSFISKYPEVPILVEPLVSLAREEMEHFREVHRLMVRLGVTVTPDASDPYVAGLLTKVRRDTTYCLLDRLVVSALIEARSHERFDLLGRELMDKDLALFYQRLARAEAGHFKVFIRLAEAVYPREAVRSALATLVRHEADVVVSAKLRPRVH